jgi:hypothetical protein
MTFMIPKTLADALSAHVDDSFGILMQIVSGTGHSDSPP